MSKSSVKFVNIKNFEVDLDRNYKISVEYVVDEDVKVSCNDWIAIYPYISDVWNSVKLELMLAYEFVLGEPIRRGERRYRIEFSLKGVKNMKYGQKYQFFYFSKPCDIYGISESFEFRPPALKENPSKSDSRRGSDEGSKENVEDKQSNDKKGKINPQGSLKEELRKSKTEDKGRSGDHNRKEAEKFITKFNQNKKVFVNKEMEIWSNSSCTIPPMLPPISCSNCYRVEGLLRAQEELYTKIKNFAEMNRNLRNQLAHMQRQVELKQAACQKLTVTLMREREAKLYYQDVLSVYEYEYPVMVMEPFVPATTVFMPNHPVPSTHRAEEKAKVGCSLLKLKAIIGSQENKIRKLTKEITKIKMERVQKVTAMVRDDSAKLQSTAMVRDDSAKLQSTDEGTEGSEITKVDVVGSGFNDNNSIV